MQVSMSNHKSTESAIKNLEIQVGQLAKQIADSSSSKFGANTENNPKEECKVVMTHGRMATMAEEEKDEKMVDEDKQELVIEPTPEPVDPFCELEEVEDEENDQEKETPISVNEEENKEKQKQKQKENEKNEKEKEERRKTKSELAREKKKEAAPTEGREVPYSLVAFKKDKERHLAWFLDIFKKLEITMPFKEALQQMPLYSKFLKDMLT